MEQDWPAAHSMDTAWWAVDAEGRVALFMTGEAGAAPLSREELSPVDPIGLVAHARAPLDCEDLFDEADGALLRPRNLWEPSGQPERLVRGMASQPPYLLWLRDEAALLALRASELGRDALRFWLPGKVVVWIEGAMGDIDAEAIFDWQEQGLLCRGWLLRTLEAWRLGLYQFSGSSFGNSLCMPYLRERPPREPLTVHQVPELRTLQPYPLDAADFDRDILLQPYEHTEATSWTNEWVSTTGEIFPDPARSAPDPAPPDEGGPARIEGGSAFVTLLAGYLDGDAAAAAVLGDWLAERGLPPVRWRASRAHRLEEAMVRFLDERQRELLEADFVERLARRRGPGSEEIAVALRVVREQDEPARPQAIQAAFRARFPLYSTTPPSRLAWAAWALISRYPLVAGRTARALAPEETGAQARALLQALLASGK